MQRGGSQFCRIVTNNTKYSQGCLLPLNMSLFTLSPLPEISKIPYSPIIDQAQYHLLQEIFLILSVWFGKSLCAVTLPNAQGYHCAVHLECLVPGSVSWAGLGRILSVGGMILQLLHPSRLILHVAFSDGILTHPLLSFWPKLPQLIKEKNNIGYLIKGFNKLIGHIQYKKQRTIIKCKVK